MEVFKFKDFAKKIGLKYFVVIPYINNNDRTKHKDLRSGKIFPVPRINLKHPDLELLQNEEMIKSYGIDLFEKPDGCIPFAYRFATNEIMFSGILEDIAKASDNALPKRGENEEVFVPIDAVVMLANGIQHFKNKTYGEKDEEVKKEKEKQNKIQQMRNAVGDF